MGAAQHERVCALLTERFDVGFHGASAFFGPGAGAAVLHKVHQVRRGNAGDAAIRGIAGGEFPDVRVFDGAPGAQNADMPGPAFKGRGFDGGHGAHPGDAGEALAQAVQGGDGGGVADQGREFGAEAPDEGFHEGAEGGAEFVPPAFAVGEAGPVRGVDQPFLGVAPVKMFPVGESPRAGVEEEDGSGIVCGDVHARGPPSGEKPFKGRFCADRGVLGFLFPGGGGAEPGIEGKPAAEIAQLLVRDAFRLGFGAVSPSAGQETLAVPAGAEVFAAIRAAKGASEGFLVKDGCAAIPTHGGSILQGGGIAQGGDAAGNIPGRYPRGKDEIANAQFT